MVRVIMFGLGLSLGNEDKRIVYGDEVQALWIDELRSWMLPRTGSDA